MKTTVEITREDLMTMVVDGVAMELDITPKSIKAPKLSLSKTSRGKHTLTFDTTEEKPTDDGRPA